ncbi:MAG: nickel pincer cofactor biosynthesis protein LarC [Desulfitobacteriaceae bacterium]
MRVLYWDAFAGMSGDMALSSLLALGVDPGELQDKLASCGLSGFELKTERVEVEGIDSVHLEVKVTEDVSHRHLVDIEHMIVKGALSDKVKETSVSVFRALAEAEACVHGITREEVHFHEVGAVDSIVDIVGTCIALDSLEIEQIVVPVLPWSRGFVKCAHGILPVPAPAALELLSGFEFMDSGITGELITPTGAALIKTLTQQGSFPVMKLLATGYGAGSNFYGLPNVLRSVLGEIKKN